MNYLWKVEDVNVKPKSVIRMAIFVVAFITV